VWWEKASDDFLTRKVKQVNEYYGKRGSVAIQIWCAAILNLDDLEKFVIRCYQLKIVFCSAMSQLPMLKMDTVIDFKFIRDWDVPNQFMPVVYGDKSMKPYLPNHVTRSMARAEEMEMSAYDVAHMQYEHYKEEATAPPSNKDKAPALEPEMDANDIFKTARSRTVEETTADLRRKKVPDLSQIDDGNPVDYDPDLEYPVDPATGDVQGLTVEDIERNKSYSSVKFWQQDKWLPSFDVDPLFIAGEILTRLENETGFSEEVANRPILGGVHWFEHYKSNGQWYVRRYTPKNMEASLGNMYKLAFKDDLD
jgi:hypothetical protein